MQTFRGSGAIGVSSPGRVIVLDVVQYLMADHAHEVLEAQRRQLW